MDKNSYVICPFCKCKETWFTQTSGETKTFQCVECSRYFKVQVSVSVDHGSRVGAAEG